MKYAAAGVSLLTSILLLECVAGFNIAIARASQHRVLKLKSSSSDDTDIDGKELPDEIAKEIEQLQQQLTYIEALEERNRAQLDSFVDEQDQWDSMEEDERQLLQSKQSTVDRLEQMTSELVSMWMGGKSMDG